MKSVFAAAALVLGLVTAAQAATLDDVKARGSLNCGVNPNLQGFGAKGADGSYAGFDVDFFGGTSAPFILGESLTLSSPLSSELVLTFSFLGPPGVPPALLLRITFFGSAVGLIFFFFLVFAGSDSS